MPAFTATPRTIIGIGSLLSERSPRLTFPDLKNFKLARIKDHRRLFQHPAAIFFERGIANKETREFSSLSAEPCAGAGFIAAVFDVPMTEQQRHDFALREEEFELLEVPFYDLSTGAEAGRGLMCHAASDAFYLERWGSEVFASKYGAHGLTSIWDEWRKPDSGILPCPVYLRHCVLAATKAGEVALDSFLDETLLVDRTTTLRGYLRNNPQVMETQPPPELVGRYSG